MKKHISQYPETFWKQLESGRPSSRSAKRANSQLYFETTEADVNFTKGDEEMAGKHPMATESQVSIPQLFRNWSTNPVNISTLLTLTSPRIYRWWGEGRGKTGELTEDVGRGWCVGDTRARDMLEGNGMAHRINLSENSSSLAAEASYKRMEAFRRNWSGQWLTQLCRWQRRRQIRTQMWWWVEEETVAIHPKQIFSTWRWHAAAAAKLLQSCPTLCDPIDGSPPGSSIPGILQARTLEWVVISFSKEVMWDDLIIFYCNWE